VPRTRHRQVYEQSSAALEQSEQDLLKRHRKFGALHVSITTSPLILGADGLDTKLRDCLLNTNEIAELAKDRR